MTDSSWKTRIHHLDHRTQIEQKYQRYQVAVPATDLRLLKSNRGELTTNEVDSLITTIEDALIKANHDIDKVHIEPE